MEIKKVDLTIISPGLPPEIGGMEKQAYLQAIHLSNSFSVKIYSSSRNEELFKDHDISFINHKIYQGKFAKEIMSIKIFFSLIIKKAFMSKGIFYFHQFNFLTFLCILLNIFFNRIFFIKVANSGKKFDLKIFFERYYFLKFFKFLINNEKINFICLNEENLNDFKKIFDKNLEIFLFRNGVEFISDSKKNESKKGSIVFFGRLEPIKNVEYVLRLAEIMQDYSFEIIGEGSLGDWIEEETSLFQNVTFKSKKALEDLNFNEIEWLILPSYAEGMSNTLLEFIARDKGIICRKISANFFVRNLIDKIVWIENDINQVVKNINSKSGFSAKKTKEFEKYKIQNVCSELEQIFKKTVEN